MKICVFRARLAALPLALTAIFSSFAQSNAPQLKETFATATRSAQPIGDVVADVTIVDRDVIERSGAAGLADVLPGYGLINLSASTALSKDWKALLRIDNLGDKVYQTVNTYATARRTLYVALTWAPQ